MTKSTVHMTRIAMFTALIVVGTFFIIPLQPVPITFQNFMVLLAAIILPATDAALSVVVYILLGLIGLPIFSSFRGGPQSIFMPSFGFLIGFAVGAFVIAKILEKMGELNFKNIFIATLIGEIVFYLIGIPYMYAVLSSMSKAPDSISGLLAIGLIPFIPGDLFKMVVVSLIAPKIKKALDLKK